MGFLEGRRRRSEAETLKALSIKNGPKTVKELATQVGEARRYVDSRAKDPSMRRVNKTLTGLHKAGLVWESLGKRYTPADTETARITYVDTVFEYSLRSQPDKVNKKSLQNLP